MKKMIIKRLRSQISATKNIVTKSSGIVTTDTP